MLDFDEDPLPDAWNRWGIGVVLPVVLTASAGTVITRHTVHIPFRRRGVNLEGHDVTALAALLLAIAVFCFVHFHGTGTERFHAARQIARVLAMIVGLLAIGVIIVHQAIPF